MRIDWELTAEFISLSAGLALAWPAVRLNQYLRRAHIHRERIDGGTGGSKYIKQLREGLVDAYTSLTWNPLDHFLTLTGVALIILSSCIRIWNRW